MSVSMTFWNQKSFNWIGIGGRFVCVLMIVSYIIITIMLFGWFVNDLDLDIKFEQQGH